MICRLPQRVALTAVLLVGLTASIGYAQPQIPNSVLRSASAPSGTNLQAVVNYVQHWLNELEASDHAARSNARQRLVDPMRSSNATSAFKRAYSTEVSQRLADKMGSNEVHVRLNTAIIAAALIDVRSFNTILAGLDDDNPGVRYWSAKALRRVLAQRTANDADPIVPAAQAQALRQTLARVIVAEQQPETLTEQLLAAVGLPGNEAKLELLQALQQRLPKRAAQPEADIDPLLIGLPPLQQQLALADPQEVSEPMRQMALTAYRYLVLSTSVLATGQGGGQADGYAKLTTIANNMLRTAALAKQADAPMYAVINRHLQAEQWQEAQEATLTRWRGLLAGQPFNFSDNELAAVRVPDVR